MESLDNTFGATFIGVLVSAVLFGLTNMQTYMYFMNCRGDSWLGLKSAVVGLWVMDALHLGVTAHGLYFYLITHYGDTPALARIVWTLKLQVVMEVSVVLTVESLYIIRIWKLYSSDHRLPSSVVVKLIPRVPTLLLLGGIAVGIVLCHETYKLVNFEDIRHIAWASITALAFATSVDFTIAFALCYFLANCKTGAMKVDSTIELLMLYTINTGILTSACSLSVIITSVVWPSNFVFLAVGYLLTKIYANSFLAMLNARQHLQTYLHDGPPHLGSLGSSQTPAISKFRPFRFNIRASNGDGWRDVEGQESFSVSSSRGNRPVSSDASSSVLTTAPADFGYWLDTSTSRRFVDDDGNVSRASSEVFSRGGAPSLSTTSSRKPIPSV